MKLDFHVHSDSSPDALHSIEQLARQAKKIGLDGIAVCDHNCFPKQGFRLKGLLILHGMECSTHEGHMSVFGVPPNFDFVRGMPAAEVARRAQKAGGISIVNHAFSVRKRKDSMRSAAFKVGATAIERFNGSDFIHNLVAMRRIPVGTGGSDAHSLYELANAYTILDCEPSEDAVLEEVRKGRVRAALAQNPFSIAQRKFEKFMKRHSRVKI
ncbi:PHP-associated [Candidatus Burarchaeum australiense]|nr:PHP-associated [Candidatus Burarchaeum australiense]